MLVPTSPSSKITVCSFDTVIFRLLASGGGMDTA